VTKGRAFDRLVNFTDAVVAVAATLLVLPIVDIAGDLTETTVWQIIADHASQLITFAFTFIVVAVMWQVHNRIFNRMIGYDGVVLRLNIVWLLGIVFLPWASKLYGEGIATEQDRWSGGEGMGGAGLLYWGTLACISVIGALVAMHVARTPVLVDPRSEEPARPPMRGFAFAVAFLVFGIVSLFAPVAASWLPLLLVPLAIVLGRRVERDVS
jgi:uncharacterized membrane protein